MKIIAPKCNWQKVFPTYSKPKAFIICQWQRDKSTPNVFYLCYRVAVFLTFFTTWLLSILDVKRKDPPAGWKAKWAIYLTNWGYTTCTLQSLLAAGMITSAYLAMKLNRPKMENAALRIYKVYWISNTIAKVLAFGITIIYWTVIYNKKTMVFDAMNYLVHGNNSVMMFIDLWMVSHPVRILHFVYPVSLGIIYTIFSVIYYLAGGTSREDKTYIYTILDWNQPGRTTEFCFGILIFIIGLHTLTWLIYKCRVWLFSKLCKVEQEGSDIEEGDKKDIVGGYVNEGMANDNV